MAKYASLLFSPEQYHQIGPFRLPVYHDLVPGEAKLIEEVSRRFTTTSYKSIQLARRVAQDKGISLREAVDLLGRANEPENEDLVFNYATELEELQSTSVGAVAQKIAFVTVLLQYRGEVQLPNTEGWTQVKDWTEADTEATPTPVLDQLFEFLTWERDGWPSGTAGNEALPDATNPPQKNSPKSVKQSSEPNP